jgi:DNA-binding MarR family transcriptional regulator
MGKIIRRLTIFSGARRQPSRARLRFQEIVSVKRREADPLAEETPFTVGPGYQIRRTHKLFAGAMRELLAERGVNYNHYYYLRELFEQDGLTPSELSERIGVERATVTTVLDTMVRERLVRRVPHSTDGRKWQIFLSRRGHGLRETVLACISAINAAAVSGLSDAEVRQFNSTLDTIATNVAAAKIDLALPA